MAAMDEPSVRGDCTYFSCGLWQSSLTHLAVDVSPQHAHVSKLKSICTCIAALTHPGLIGAAAHVQQMHTGTVTTSGDGHFFLPEQMATW